jgi:hypothetical protein
VKTNCKDDVIDVWTCDACYIFSPFNNSRICFFSKEVIEGIVRHRDARGSRIKVCDRYKRVPNKFNK